MEDLNKDEHINEGEVHKKLPPQPLSSSRKIPTPKKCTSKGQNRLSGVKEIRTIQTFTSILSVAQQYH
jgi:hypothetical protein